MKEVSESGLDKNVVGFVAGPKFSVDPRCSEIIYITEVLFD